MSLIFELLRKRKSEAIWLSLFALLPIFVGSSLIFLVVKNRQYLEGLSGSGWLLIFFLLSLPIAFSLIPNTLAGLIAGYFLGWLGLPAMVLSFSLACLIGFFIGGFSGKGLLDDVCSLWPSLSGIIQRFKDKPFSLVVALRLMPAPPFAIGSLVLAWIKIPLKSFFWGSLAGMIPRMSLVVWLGHLGGDLQRLASGSAGDYRVSLAITAFAGLGLLILYFRFFRKQK